MKVVENQVDAFTGAWCALDLHVHRLSIDPSFRTKGNLDRLDALRADAVDVLRGVGKLPPQLSGVGLLLERGFVDGSVIRDVAIWAVSEAHYRLNPNRGALERGLFDELASMFRDERTREHVGPCLEDGMRRLRALRTPMTRLEER